MPHGRPGWRPGQKFSTWPAADPRLYRIRTGPSGPVALPPSVITVGVNAIAATSANVVGSINPNGLATTWWVVYGTSLPFSPGSSTASASLGAGTTPQTVTASLTGLTTGLTYYFVIVGSSAAGQEYGAVDSFVPAVPISPSGQPVVPFGQSQVTIPHFDVPFRLVTSGTRSGAVVVEQDTLEEVFACVNTIVECAVGQCPQLPSFGRPDLTFSQGPVDTTELVYSIQQLEPRATEDAIVQQFSDSTWGVTLNTSTTGAAKL